MAATIPTPGANCASSLGLQNTNPGTLNNNETALTVAQATVTAVWDISEIGYSLLLADTPALPLLPLISLGFAVDEIVNAFGGGKPKFADTQAVIDAYRKSAYWPLHALADDLAIAEKNGAPISDSRPAIQAQFSTWKNGTIESLQSLAGFQPGKSSPGYWQLQRLINTSWAQSGGGETAVYQVVRAMDRFVEILACLHSQIKVTPPPGPAPAPEFNPCENPDPSTDEILDLCSATQKSIAALSDSIAAITTTQSGGADENCCKEVVAAIAAVTAQLTTIAQALAFPPQEKEKTDFAPIVEALHELAARVPNYAPLIEVCCKALNTSLAELAGAIAKKPPTDVSGIVAQLKTIAEQGDVDQFIFTALQQQGFITNQDAQVLQGIKWADAVSYLTHTAAWRTLEKKLHAVKADADAATSWLDSKIKPATNWAVGALESGFTTERNALQDVISPILDAIKSSLRPGGPVDIGNIGVDPDKVLADAAAVLLNTEIVGLLVSLIAEGAGETIEKIGEVVGGLLGFEELREVQLGPLVRYGIARVAEMQARALYRQEIPAPATAGHLVARGLLPKDAYDALSIYGGQPKLLDAPVLAGQYMGISAFILIRLIETGIYTSDDLRDELTFSGMRPRSQHRLLAGADYLATASYRSKLEGAIETAYKTGWLSETELTERIDSAEHNYDRDSLIREYGRLEKLMANGKDIIDEYMELYLAGLINDETYRGYLSGLGLQADTVDAIAGKAEARANATLRRKELAAAARLEKATTAIERRTAIQNYLEGNINLEALTATLIATGLTPIQAAAWADLQELRKGGSLRWLYGMQLPAAQANVLRARISALTDQRKRLLITQKDYTDALTQLGLNETWVNALDAKAEAMLTPKTSAFPVTVQTG